MRYYEFDAVVIGTGAAGYNGACRIAQLGKKSVAIVTEGICMGTSRNTGSDKQTYYKLGLCGETSDSVFQMASDLFAGGSMDGDTALCEAALSARCFLNLAELGVPFPTNRYGEYVGYKTDHDPRARATSAGPLTSKFMTEALQKQAESLQIPVFDGLLAVEVLKDASGVRGLVCLEKATGEFAVFCCGSVLLATGGPAGIYEDSVYPAEHTGSTGLALSAGAALQNLTYWQYGLASVSPRWNVSGTYMQVLPRVISVDEYGVEREFLQDAFPDPYVALSMVFLKGYQWPFDSQKSEQSSCVDLLVYRETVQRKRRVYLDYTKNPFGLETMDYKKLSAEAYDYLSRAQACFGNPIQRLKKMNQPAIQLYRDKGVDLYRQPLEIALCAQHCNGGIAVDLWWQTAVSGLYAAGECAGTHGIRRPGGSALNSGQVGSLRAAQHISASERRARNDFEFKTIAQKHLQEHMCYRKQLLENSDNVMQITAQSRRMMSDCAAAIRDVEKMHKVLTLDKKSIGVASMDKVFIAYQLRDQLKTQQAVLTAMTDYAGRTGASAGSALYFCGEKQLPVSSDDGTSVQEVYLTEKGYEISWRDVRPLPKKESFFENVWRKFRENGNVY